MKRHHVKRKAFHAVLEGAPARLREILRRMAASGPEELEVAMEGEVKIYLVGGAAVLLEKPGGTLLPPVTRRELVDALPRVVVDMGAVPRVCNGADVMRPGVRRVEGEFERGSLVAVVDERHGQPVAVGRSLLASAEMAAADRGKVVENLHYVGDRCWRLLRALG